MKTTFLFVVLAILTGSSHAADINGYVTQHSSEVQIPAIESGVIATLHFKQGALVEKGQVVATMDTRKAELELNAAKLQRKIAEQATKDTRGSLLAEELQVAESRLKGIQEISASTSASEIENLKLKVLSIRTAMEENAAKQLDTKSKLDLAEVAVAAAELKMSSLIIKANATGLLVKISKKVGEQVQSGEAVATFWPTEEVVVTFSLPLEDARAAMGKSIRVKSTDLVGTITHYEPFVTSHGSMRVHATFTNSGDKLLPGEEPTLVVE